MTTYATAIEAGRGGLPREQQLFHIRFGFAHLEPYQTSCAFLFRVPYFWDADFLIESASIIFNASPTAALYLATSISLPTQHHRAYFSRQFKIFFAAVPYHFSS